MVGGFARQAVPGLVALQAEPDPGDPNRYVMFAGPRWTGPAGRGVLPTRRVRRDSRSVPGPRVGILRPRWHCRRRAQAQQVFDLETEIAATHWDKVKCRDLRLMYNLMSWMTSLQAVQDCIGGSSWPVADIAESKMGELVAMQPSFFTEVSNLLTEDRLPAWRAWARWKVISSLSPYLSSAFVDENFRFYGTVLSGTPELRERWKRGVALVEASVGEAVGKIYVDHYFSPAAKERMDQLVANLIEAYRRSITDLDWMTEETKESALAKLAKFRPHIGYPTKWRDYSSLVITEMT